MVNTLVLKRNCTFQSAGQWVKDVARLLFVQRHLVTRGRLVESGVFVIPLPLRVNGLSQPRHKVHPFAVGDGLQSGDLHSHPGLARRRNLSRETVADTEVSLRLLTADSSMCGQPPQIFSGDATRPQRSRRFQTTSRFRQHFIYKCTS